MAALAAAQAGDVLLIDTSPLPRDKSCGGMLNPHALEFLRPFGEPPDSAVLSPDTVRFRYVDWDRHIDKPTGLAFLNVDRALFDEWLLGLLPDNVTVLPGTPLDALAIGAGHVRASVGANGDLREIDCEHLVGADGARSRVRREIGVESTRTYVTLQDTLDLDGDLPAYFDCIYMRDVGDCYAYSYVVPKGASALVGSVFYPKTKRPHEKHEEVLRVLRAAMPQLRASTKRQAAAALSVRAASDVVTGRGRVLLAGEAGGFMSPTSGEGISYAMNSGWLAGSAIAEAGGVGALETYERSVAQIRTNIARKLRWLPFMESRAGKYVAGFLPQRLVSRVTEGL